MFQNISKNIVQSELKFLDNDFSVNISDFNEKENKIIQSEFKAFGEKIFQQKKVAILGYDIYRYSKYEEDKQKFIPFIFEIIFDNAISYVQKSEPTFFGNFQKYIISTGDGGFILFTEPFYAFLFNLYFYMSLHLFNTGHYYPKLSHYVGEIVIRSAITYDNIYYYENNYYGKGIIDNSRILKSDKLNRFLIDKKSYEYFGKKFNGIETIQIITKEILKKSLNITNDINSFIFKRESYRPNIDYYKNENILNIHIQKIDETLSKDTLLTIYNIEIQILISIINSINPKENTSYILTIGNSNSM